MHRLLYGLNSLTQPFFFKTVHFPSDDSIFGALTAAEYPTRLNLRFGIGPYDAAVLTAWPSVFTV